MWCVQNTGKIYMACRYIYSSAHVYRCVCVDVCRQNVKNDKSSLDGNDISFGNLPGLHPSHAGAAVC